jgi:hypothetical protein
MGLKKDLHLVGDQFSFIASGYAFSHLAMQFPKFVIRCPYLEIPSPC